MTHVEEPNPSIPDPTPAVADATTPPTGPATEPATEPAAEVYAAPPSIADGVRRRLDPRMIPLGRLVGAIVAAAVSTGLLLVLGIVSAAADLGPWIGIPLLLLGLAVLVVLAWLAYRWPELEHRHASYRVDEQGIEIRRGVIWRRILNVPRSRVQHIDVSQGPLERRYQLGTLVIYTAGSDHAKVGLPGLEHGTALEIRDHLLPREGDDAV